MVIEQGQGEQHTKSGHDESQPGQHPAPPSGTSIAYKDPDLNPTRTWQGVHERQPLQKLGSGDPAAFVLDLCLDDAHGGPAVIQGANLQEHPKHLPPVLL